MKKTVHIHVVYVDMLSINTKYPFFGNLRQTEREQFEDTQLDKILFSNR